jgi:hypothetical protein
MKENKFLNNHFSLLKIVVLVFQIYTTVRMYLSKAEFNFKQLTLYPANYTINMSTVYTFTFGRVNYNNGSETPWSTNVINLIFRQYPPHLIFQLYFLLIIL